MKPIKMLGLAALAALMAMAFAGASSAMAETTAYCEFETEAFEEICPEGHRVTHIHEVTLTGAKAKILNTVGNVECDVLFLGTTPAPLFSPLFVFGAFTYTNCKRGSENCSVVEENGPGLKETLKVEFEKAEVKLKLFLIRVVCGPFIKCSFNVEEMPGIALGKLRSSEENGEVSFTEGTLPKEGTGICPAQTKLDIVTTPLDPLYIAK